MVDAEKASYTSAMLLVATAAAHLPHDDVDTLAAPAALDDSQPWLLFSHPYGAQVVAASADAGNSWTQVGGLPEGATVLDSAWCAAELLLSRGASVLRSPDGAAWAESTLPFELRAVACGEAAWLATEGGLYRLDAEPVLVQAGDFAEVEAEGAVAAAVGADGGVWALVDGAWSDRPGLVATAVSPDGAWAGDAGGQLWRWDGGWVACAPLEVAEGDPAVVHIALADGAPVVLSGAGGPWLGDASCASWTDRSVLRPDFSEFGGPSDAADAFSRLQIAGDRWLVASSYGLYLSEDAGESWAESAWFPPDVIRGIAFANVATNRVYRGSYSTGVEVTRDGGESWDPPGLGPLTIAAQEVGVPLGGDLPGEAWGLVNHEPWRTRTGGETWRPMEPPYTNTGDLFSLYSLDHLWAFPTPPLGEGLAGVLESRDGGASWAPIAAIEAEADGARGIAAFLHVHDGTSHLCIAMTEPTRLFCSPEFEDDWSLVHGDEGRIAAAVAWPAEDPVRLLLVSEGRVRWSEDHGQSWSEVETGLNLAHVAVDDDGGIWGASAEGGLHRSEDGGLSWSPELVLDAPIYQLAPRPGTDELLIGSHDGGWRWSGGELARWGALERVDDAGGFFSCVGCGAELRADAALRSVSSLPAGAVASFALRGHELRLYGSSDGLGVVEVEIDGRSVARFQPTARAEVGELGRVEGLADRWHQVRIYGLESGLWLDYAEARGEDVALNRLDTPTHPEPEGCSCATGPGAATLLPALLLRRRRR